MKRAPSVLVPESAKNRSPALTARLSEARPDTSIAPAFAGGTIVASSPRRSESFIVFQSVRYQASPYRKYRAAAPGFYDRYALPGMCFAGTPYWVVFDAARIRRSDGGRSKRGSIPSSGAIRVIALAAVGTAFQP